MTNFNKFIIFGIISNRTGLPMEIINQQMLIPLKFQEDIITEVIYRLRVYLPLECKEGLTIGEIIDAANEKTGFPHSPIST